MEAVKTHCRANGPSRQTWNKRHVEFMCGLELTLEIVYNQPFINLMTATNPYFFLIVNFVLKEEKIKNKERKGKKEGRKGGREEESACCYIQRDKEK